MQEEEGVGIWRHLNAWQSQGRQGRAVLQVLNVKTDLSWEYNISKAVLP